MACYNALHMPSRQLRNDHYALFGSVRIPRGWCEDCNGPALIVDGKIQCCGAPRKFFGSSVFIHLSSPRPLRKLPSYEVRESILEQQEFACFYCRQSFGEMVQVTRGKFTFLRVCWEHVVPFAFAQNNNDENFVAACQYCNSWKASRMFDSVEEIIDYVTSRWEKIKRRKDVSSRSLRQPGVCETVRQKERVEPVLFAGMPLESVGVRKPKNKKARAVPLGREEKISPLPHLTDKFKTQYKDRFNTKPVQLNPEMFVVEDGFVPIGFRRELLSRGFPLDILNGENMTHRCAIVVPGREKPLQAFVVDPDSARKWCVDNLNALGEKWAGLSAQIFVIEERLVETVSFSGSGDVQITKKQKD